MACSRQHTTITTGGAGDASPQAPQGGWGQTICRGEIIVFLFFLRQLGVIKADLDETWGNSSYKPSGASYTAQGPQKQPEIFKNLLYYSITNPKNPFVRSHANSRCFNSR